MTDQDKVVLSLFPGAGLLDKGFEAEGWFVVRGPDTLWGGDIRNFSIPAGIVKGVMGGSPCQDFSRLRRCAPSGNGIAMLHEFARVVTWAAPDWFLLENVPGVPDLNWIRGYHVQRLNLAASECRSSQRRIRCIQFGNRLNKLPLVIPRGSPGAAQSQPAATASEGQRVTRRKWADFCELQGLPRDFDLPGLTRRAKYQAVGNGVPVPMARVLARAVASWSVTRETTRVCICDCGRPVKSGQTLATAACRKRMERRRKLVTELGGKVQGASQVELLADG